MGDWRGHTEFWWSDLRESYHFKDTGIDESIILKFIFKKWFGETLNGLVWLRIGTDGGLL